MTTNTLQALGWKPVFQQQLSLEEMETAYPARVRAVHKNAISLLSNQTVPDLPVALFNKLPALTVGDWVLLDSADNRPQRLLERDSLIRRRAAGDRAEEQLIAANVDILLIVTSCNADFNPARLERYLAVAFESGVLPMLVLTKSDLCEAPEPYIEAARKLHAGLLVETVNSLDAQSLAGIAGICTPGTTLAMVGSSGVGKSTLANTLGATGQDTAAIREDDAKGRHTTTVRSLHRIVNGALLIDMPGMRELQLAGAESGVNELFDDLRGLGECRFKDCSHRTEPGCAVLAAVASGNIDQRRLDSYHKLLREQRWHNESIAERNERMRKQGKLYKSVQHGKRQDREGSH